MSSFTDTVPQFSGYVAQPVEAFVQVGLQKQAQFNQGLERVQGAVNSLIQLPIAKAETQEYVKSKVSELRDGLSKSVTGDFSDGRLLNQVTGYSSRIASDPIVQNGVLSTMKAQAAQKQIEEDRKQGKLMTQNEYDFQDGYQKWLNDGDATTSFDGGYSTGVDILKRFTDAFHEIHSDTDDDAFRIGKDGKPEINPAMLRTKGISPDKVAGVWNLISQQPDVQNQLRINAKYQFRGATPQALADYHKASYEETIGKINQSISNLQIKMQTDKTVNKAEASQVLEQLKNQGTELLKNYQAGAAQLESGNFDAYKTAVYENNFRSSLIRDYSWSEKEFVANPFFTAQMQTLNYELDKAQFGLEQKKFQYQIQHDAIKDNLEMMRIMKGKNADGSSSSDTPDMQTNAGNIAETEGNKGSTTFHENLQANKEQLSQGIGELIFSVANRVTDTEHAIKNPIKFENGSYVYNVDPTGKTGYKSMKEAKDAGAAIYKEARISIQGGKAPLDVIRIFNNQIDPLVRTVRNQEQTAKKIDDRYAPALKEVLKGMGNVEAGMVDYWMVQNKVPGWEAAAKRLKQSNYSTEDLRAAGPSPGIGAPGQAAGKKFQAYQKLSQTLAAHPEVSGSLQQREQAYKNAQVGYVPTSSTFLAGKAGEKEVLRQRFSGVAAAIMEGNNSSEVKDFLSWLKEGTKDDKFTDANVYGVSKVGNDHYLTVQRGTETRKLKVEPSDLAQIPGAIQQNAFWNKFGHDLELTQNTSTDVTKSGVNSAYVLERPGNSKYAVQYHVLGNGKGSYDLQLFIRDNKTGKMILNGVTPGLSADMNGIMNALEELRSKDALIDGFILSQTNQ